MPIYRAPVDEVLFLLFDVLGFERYGNLPGFAEASRETVASVLDEAAKFCEGVLVPLNRTGDVEGCTRHPDGRVATPAGFKEAYRAFAEGGWVGLAADPEHGGTGLPGTLAAVVNEFLAGANMAFGMYPGLSQGAIAALSMHGSAEQKDRWLTRLVSGEWLATMNLTEPQCGTDLGLIRTRATPNGDGSYAISGQKIFISGGEHDLSDNIVHLVLARIDGAPAGTKGISLFLAPKMLPGADGRPAARNALACASIEHKMGIHGNATCTMAYEGATAWLVGAENRGLQAMFTMMNEARLGVAIQGLGLSEVAYQNAAAYARERLQGRALTGPKAADRPADPILVHPDIRRTLLEIRAFNIAARALMLSVAISGDVARRSAEEAERQAAEDRMGLLTPVVKAMFTDRGFANTVAAQQVFGGAGYIAETGVEQFVRDARIAMIYEGANGIQAMDLVGRKLPRDGGRALKAFFAEVEVALSGIADIPALQALQDALKKGRDDLQAATSWLIGNALTKPDNAGAGATDYLHLFGLVALGAMWARIGAASHAEGGAATAHRLMLARIFAERLLPETGLRLARVKAGAASLMDYPDAAL